ncbi:MAG: hypothetical protein QOJ40_3065 [Verrucomicrobiota bacterium]
MLRSLAIALASLSFLPAAQGIQTFTAYDLGVTFTNDSAGYWSVNGAPTTTGTSFLQITPINRSASVQTDDTGKITGTGMLQVIYNQAGLPYSIFTVTYSGQISSPSGAPPIVKIAIKGSGYTVDGTGGPTTTANSMSLEFVGQPGPNPLNNNQTRIVGQLTGTIRGQTPLATVSATLPSLQAVISGSSSNVISLNTTVVQSNTRMVLFKTGFSGGGVIHSSGGYTLSLVGADANHGETLLFSGMMGPYTNQISGNPVGFTAPVSAQFKGKIKGQLVSGTADASLITPTLVQ